jgi:two-component system phosphate regulon sensor histidine kinase PhoR
VEDLKKDLESQKANLQLQSEEHAALMSAVSDAVLAVDLEGTPLFYNSRFALLLGKGQTIRGKHIDKLLNDAILVHAFKEALTTGKVSSVNALPMDTETGKYFFSVSVSPLARKNGQVYGAIGIFYDVTELKRAEQIRINFVANVSHELRTPLTAIKGFTDTLIQDQQNGRPIENEFLQIIARNTGRLMNLINDLLDLSAIESNEIANKALIKTEDVTKAIIQQIKPSFDSKKQKISVNILAPNVMADQQRLEQVLVNLLANANKYTQQTGNVTVSWEYGKNQSVLLKVTDDGPGISVENQARLFERFYRVDKSRSREQGGTGLGLAIVKHIMQSHGGSVHIESPSSGGSTFVCVFPA